MKKFFVVLFLFVSSTIFATEDTTMFQGAKVLSGEYIEIDCSNYDDELLGIGCYKSGNSLVLSTTTEDLNAVSVIADFFWFQSSMQLELDYYVIVFKVMSSPNLNESYILKKQTDIFGYTLPWTKDETAQNLTINMDPSGENGIIRWEKCIPFETYAMSPLQVVNVKSDVSVSADAGGNVKGGAKFGEIGGEGSALINGAIDSDYKVSSQYTITLYQWLIDTHIFSNSIRWQMILQEIPENDCLDGSICLEQGSAYHEYFLVVESEKGKEVVIDNISFGASFDDKSILGFDEEVEATFSDIRFSSPSCTDKGYNDNEVCDTEFECNLETGDWECIGEEEEIDYCGGITFFGECMGDVTVWCEEEIEVKYIVCDSGCCGPIEVEGFEEYFYDCVPAENCGIEECIPECIMNECGWDGCDGYCGECEEGYDCINNLCIEEEIEEECNIDCYGKTCGGDGCGGSCGVCTNSDEICSIDGLCVQSVFIIEEDVESIEDDSPEDGEVVSSGGCVVSSESRGIIKESIILMIILLFGLILLRDSSR